MFFFFFKLNKQYVNKQENSVPRTLFEDRKVAGSAEYKQSKMVWNCVELKVSLFSHEMEVCLFI